ncbi:hypothetical protein PHLCEN_2v4830 [Hermanssonia centrifuga]|uniref:Major facilitator superfamily (MFS) profile domain-containing protein n=1 Tax=Hermanssonia centrifuga TaxID=98765 RepID=A0A2R6PG48_9APHY|nr:hypothetical protein PHLCEN_2v4830 [Hermanssonia centrifuga]
MIGNILSALVWIQSTSFASYMLSRIIGGLSEGNVQLAIAILSDITTPANRAKALAHVGIAFAICFCIGPPIGAYFASRPLPTSFSASGFELNVYATPALLTLVLLLLETIFLAVALPETRGKRAQVPTEKAHTNGHANGTANGNGVSNGNGTANGNGVSKEANGKANGHHAEPKASAAQRMDTLKTLRKLHFMFLGVFSGVEFTLTFLTFDLFDWNNKQNGALIGSIGIISALLQGGYVRRAIPKLGEGAMARRGVSSCAIGLILLSVVPLVVTNYTSLAVGLVRAACVCMAFTSATVVNSLTSYASLQCDDGVDEDTGKVKDEHPELAKGKALGKFRSSGQLGRAIGPLLGASSLGLN